LRFQGKSRLGFFALPLSKAQRIRRFAQFPKGSSSAIDPCIGDGAAFEVITDGAEVLRYGVELNAYRAEQAKQRIPNIVQGNTLEVQCPVESFGLLYLNPPYDWALGSADSRRTEQSFLSHTYRWLKPGGVLIFVIPRRLLVTDARPKGVWSAFKAQSSSFSGKSVPNASFLLPRRSEP
jgi:hypothetical protein